MSVPHVYVAVEMIEAYIIWVGEVIRCTDTPLTDTGGLVACFLKDGGYGWLAGLYNNWQGRVTTNNCSPHVFACK